MGWYEDGDIERELASEAEAERQADRDQIELSIHTTRTGPCR